MKLPFNNKIWLVVIITVSIIIDGSAFLKLIFLNSYIMNNKEIMTIPNAVVGFAIKDELEEKLKIT